MQVSKLHSLFLFLILFVALSISCADDNSLEPSTYQNQRLAISSQAEIENLEKNLLQLDQKTSKHFLEVWKEYLKVRLAQKKLKAPNTITNANGPSLYWENGGWVIEGDGNLTLNGYAFYSLKRSKYVLTIRNHRSGKIVITNSFFTGGDPWLKGGFESKQNGRGILVENSSNVTIQGNQFEGLAYTSIRVVGSQGKRYNNIVIADNIAVNTQAETDSYATWTYQAYFLSIMNINGNGHLVYNNRILNWPGASFLTDLFNFYQTGGISKQSPMKVAKNSFLGPGASGHYNFWGALMQIGDHASNTPAGNYLYATDNVFVHPGMLGININGGTGHHIQRNIILHNNKFSGFSPDSGQWETNRTPWKSIGLNNYKKDGASKDHVVQDNYYDCPWCSSKEVDVEDSKNVVVKRNSNQKIGTARNLLPADYLSGKGCVASVLFWKGNSGLYCKALVKGMRQNQSLNVNTERADANQGSVQVTCKNGVVMQKAPLCKANKSTKKQKSTLSQKLLTNSVKKTKEKKQIATEKVEVETMSKCMIEVKFCQNNYVKPSVFEDKMNGANSNQQACFQRATDYANSCQNNKSGVLAHGAAVIATYHNSKAVSKTAKRGADGCLISLNATCKIDNRLKSGTVFYDNYENANQSKVRCLKRKEEYAAYCQIPSSKVKATFYRKGQYLE